MKCEICGKEIDLTYCTEYIYKRYKYGKMHYFCGFNCRKKFDERRGRSERKELGTEKL